MSKHRKKRKVKIRANEIYDAEVHWVSLVKSPANRIPFKILKSDNKDQIEESIDMINLNSLFTKKSVKPDVVAIVIHKSDVEWLKPQLEDNDINVSNPIERDDLIIYKQCEFDEKDTQVIQSNEHIAIMVTGVKKQFHSFVDSMNFEENLKSAGFIPGLHMGSEAFFDTVRSALFDEDSDATEVKATIKSAIDAYADFLGSLVDDIPEKALKMEAIVFKKPSVDIKKEDVSKLEDSKSDESKEGTKKSDEPESKTEETKKEDSKETGTEAKKSETKAKKSDEDNKNETETEEVSNEDSKPKESDMSEVLKALTTINDTVTKNFDEVKKEISGIKKSNKTLSDKIEEVENVAKSTKDTVNGTVISSADEVVRDESFTNRERSQKSDDDLWDGVGALEVLSQHK